MPYEEYMREGEGERRRERGRAFFKRVFSCSFTTGELRKSTL
jgi:hypothetical protein